MPVVMARTMRSYQEPSCLTKRYVDHTLDHEITLSVRDPI